MADRRPDDDTPLAPHRSLSGREQDGGEEPQQTKRPLSERVSAAVSSAGARVTPTSDDQAGASSSSQPKSRDEKAPPAGASAAGQGTPERKPAASSTKKAGLGVSLSKGRPRRARLRLTHVDPWSVMKTAFLLAIAIGVVTVVAVALVWSVLGAAGVWESINRTVADVLGEDTSQAFDIETYVGTSRVIGFTMIVAVVDVILITAVATLGAFLYNLSAALLGGLEVTLTEDER